jgi:MFS family permease
MFTAKLNTLPYWLSPLKFKVFRTLWTVWLIANVCMWMNDVAAAWMMTTLTDSPLLIALVQTASNLPVLLLGVPSGALADILNRKKYFVITQLWLAANATILTFLMVFDLLTAQSLLFFTFMNGIGLAMRWPVFAVIVPDLVNRDYLARALTLNGLAMNASRIIGPLIAGIFIASLGSQYVFGLNMVLCLLTTYVVLQWKYQHFESALPGERFFGAMRLGIQYVSQSTRMRFILIRAFLFYFQASCVIALLPLLAKSHFHGNANTFTLLMSSLGFGAILAGSQLPRFRDSWNNNQLSNYGILVLCVSSICIVLVPSLWEAVPLMVIYGMSWFTVANSLTVTAQFSLPGWIRARAMSFYQMSLMGGSAIGAAFWGKVATHYGVVASVLLAAVFGLLSMFYIIRLVISGQDDEDLSPVCPIERPNPSRPIDHFEGPVMISIEYHIDPQRDEDFKKIMKQTKVARIKQGALSWSLFADAEHPGQVIEYFVYETWADYLRRFDRFTAADLHLQEERFKFHIDPDSPKIVRRIASQLKD